MDSFTFVEREVDSNTAFRLFDDVVHLNGAKMADPDLQYVVALRKAFPELIVSAVPVQSVPLRNFAAAGFASCDLDLETDSYASWRGYVAPRKRSDKGLLGESVDFAKYHYRWKDEDFLLYLVGNVQYILKECRGNENHLGPSSTTDQLIRTVGDWINTIEDVVWVYDRYWFQDHELYKDVQKASWDNVILDEDVKKDLQNVAHKFFESEDVYRKLGVPWKRGLMFHGPPGNGKTISIKALMNSLYNREKTIPTLYVRSAPYTWDLSDVFRKARAQAPCMLVLEDVETIVTPDTRSYFFNELDGLQNNDGLFIVASTNFLDKLDPGLSNRPSRFDRKYLFPLPNEHERTLYCEYWRKKVKKDQSDIAFPLTLCPAMAHITIGEEDESASDVRPFDSDNDDLDDYKLWVVFKQQAEILRKQIGNEDDIQSRSSGWSTWGISAAKAPSGFSENARQLPTPPVMQQSQHSRRVDAFKPAPPRLGTNGELLAELPWYVEKTLFVNPAAMERGDQQGLSLAAFKPM